MVRVHGFTVHGSGDTGASMPSVSGGFVGPKPFPHSVQYTLGFGKPLGQVRNDTGVEPMTSGGYKVWNSEGAALVNVMGTALLSTLLSMTSTFSGVPSRLPHGMAKLICSGDR